MNISYVIFSLLVGWCGNEVRLWRWWRWWQPPIPIPDPNPPDPKGPLPDPWGVIDVISPLAGLGGAFLVTQIFQSEVSLITVSLGAFVGARVATNLYDKLGNQIQTLK